MATGDALSQSGFYCSTSGTYFSEHAVYDAHVAGLPPVTKEWFEARKAQLTSASAAAHQKIWYDPLTKRKFQTHNTYQAHVNSKKYQELVKQSGQPAPAPVIMMRKLDNEQEPAVAAKGWETASEDDDLAAVDDPLPATGVGSKVAVKRRAAAAAAADSEGEDEQQEVDEEEWEEWDMCVSFFDNKRSNSMQENLEYMYKQFGFYLPDADQLTDPEGLLKYLGAKLQYGKVPLYTAGDDANAKQFRSLHAVQRHMVDTNQCKMLFSDNEDEYADFYHHASSDGEDEDEASSAGQSAGEAGRQLALATGGLGALNLGSSSAQGFELTVAAAGDDSSSTAAGKTLGSRELARSLGVDTASHQAPPEAIKRAQKEKQRQQRQWLNLAMRTNINNNLPKNVPY
eukprot:gene13233-13364_t